MIEVGFPERMQIFNETQLNNFIKEWNGKRNIYRSVYTFKKFKNHVPDYTTAIINQIYFDFDENTHEIVKTFCEKLKRDNIMFRVNFSGRRGFHIYISCDHRGIERKSYLLSLHNYFIRNYNLVQYDSHVIGNIRQLRRIENSLNLGGNRYCIPLTYDEIFLSFDEIKELARHPKCYKYHFIEGKIFKLEQKYILDSINNYDVSSGSGELKDLPELPEPCILRILHLIHPSHEERFLLALWLSHHFRGGYDINDYNLEDLKERIIYFIRNLNWDDYSEALNTCKSTKYQVNNIINKRYNFVPNCQWRQLHGICCSSECKE